MHYMHHVHVSMLSCFSHVRLCETPWTVAHQAPLSMGFSRQEYWSGLPCPPPDATQIGTIYIPCIHIRLLIESLEQQYGAVLSFPIAYEKVKNRRVKYLSRATDL